MDELAKKLSENGRKIVIFVRQEDGAGPHNDKTYMKFMEDEFEERDWIKTLPITRSKHMLRLLLSDSFEGSIERARIVIWRTVNERRGVI